MWLGKAARLLADTAILLVLAAVISGFLLRLAPGSGVDERSADPRLSAGSVEEMNRALESRRAGVARTAAWFWAALRGDLGVSETTGEPVLSLLAERVPVTLRSVLIGAAGGFLAAVAAAATSAALRRNIVRSAAAGLSVAALSVPSGLLALAAVFLRLPVELAIATAVFPRIFLPGAELFAGSRNKTWLLSAYAAGIPRSRLWFRFVVPALRTELGGLAGLAAITALAVSVPAEVLTGRPGLGELAWQSASGRDLPVVVGVTLTMALLARAITVLSAAPSRNGGAAI